MLGLALSVCWQTQANLVCNHPSDNPYFAYLLSVDINVLRLSHQVGEESILIALVNVSARSLQNSGIKLDLQ